MVIQQGVTSIDLSNLPEKYDVKLEIGSSEPPDERASRLKILQEEAKHLRWRVTAVYAAAAISIVSITVICIFVVLDSRFSADDKAWARPILTALVAGLAGYLVKDKISKE